MKISTAQTRAIQHAQKWRECSARDIKLSTASQTELSNTRKVCRGLHDRYQDGRHNENLKSTSAVTLDLTVVPLRFTIVCQHLLLNRPGKKWSQGIRSTATTNKNAFNIAKQALRAFQSIAQAHQILRPPQKLSPGSTSDIDPHLPTV